MAQKGKRNADDKLLTALACGATIETAARQAGLSESTVYRRLNAPDFDRRLREVRADMMQRANGMLTAASMESVKTLLELQKPAAPPPVRLGAAKAVLEIGMKVREVVDIVERIAALEAQVGGSPAA